MTHITNGELKEQNIHYLNEYNPNLFAYLVDNNMEVYLEVFYVRLAKATTRRPMRMKKGAFAGNGFPVELSMLQTSPSELRDRYGVTNSSAVDDFIDLCYGYAKHSIANEMFGKRPKDLNPAEEKEVMEVFSEEVKQYIAEVLEYCAVGWDLIGYNFDFYGQEINPMFQRVW